MIEGFNYRKKAPSLQDDEKFKAEDVCLFLSSETGGKEKNVSRIDGQSLLFLQSMSMPLSTSLRGNVWNDRALDF